MIRELAPSDDLELNEVSTTAAPSENSKLHEVMYTDASLGVAQMEHTTSPAKPMLMQPLHTAQWGIIQPS